MLNHTSQIYSNLFPVLWESISNALTLCIKYKKEELHDNLTETNIELISCFTALTNSPKKDSHIIEGLYESHQVRKDIYPRVLKLTLIAFNDAQNINAKGAYLIPSPLNIIYNLFIVPKHSYTAAYSIATCRSFLFHLFNIFPEINNDSSNNEINNYRSFTESQIMDSLNDFEGFEKLILRWPKITISNPDIQNSHLSTPEIHSFLGHFLSTKGIAHLWFKNIKQALDFLKFDNELELLEGLRTKMPHVRFRRSSRYNELPDWGEIINQIFGFPIPIRGADILFFSGLKPSYSGGLVISVSGSAGVGKTSFALALANSFSPFGTQCFYISLEEEIPDIERRLHSLRPHIEKELSFVRKKTDWFFGIKYFGDNTLESFSEEIVLMADELNSVINNAKRYKDSTLHTVCPYMIVIDNLTELLLNQKKNDYFQIENFIDKCRKLNAIVLLLSPEGILEKFKLEYLVDTVIQLENKDIENENAKPIRIFNLIKTRQQLSRQGAHIFHMSGKEGFRISPQIPSQIDRKEKIKRNLHDENNLIHTLNYLNENSIQEPDEVMRTLESKINLSKSNLKKNLNREFFIKLFPRTQILVHGFGSAGKAGFSIKMLLTPPVSSKLKFIDILKNDFSHLKYRRKILIISFLYPEKYYDELISTKINIKGRIRSVYKNLPDPIIEYIVFYPGYLGPQDFLSKVTRKLDEANLMGQPFTGVIVDGLHNIFVQFEKLQHSNMVWPMLYNILSRYNVTVVSTFTNFSLNDKLFENDQSDRNKMVNQAVPDYLLLQKGMTPFLHALVQASDYYFFLEQHTSPKNGSKRYLLAVKSSISQSVPEEFLEWDRQENIFCNVYTLPMLRDSENGELINSL